MQINMFAAMAAFACVALASCGPTSAEKEQAAPAASAATSETPVATAAGPANVGDCAETTVTLVGPRLEGVPGSGSAIQYANGVTQVEYEAIPGIDHSKAGDPVRLCLTSIPENCPPGDNRGRVYSATNTRTGETWSAPDSEHMCGGA